MNDRVSGSACWSVSRYNWDHILKKKKKKIEISQLDGITSAELTGDFDGESRAHLVEVDGIGSAEEEE